MKMPGDRFTNTKVFWRRIDNDDKTFCAAIQLPSESVIKEEIISDPQSNVRLAKQQAAFKACVALYHHGELDDNLVPFDDEKKIELHEHEYFQHWKAFAGDDKSAGTMKNRRCYQNKMPAALENCAPRVGQINYLYRIHVQPKFKSTTKAIATLEELLGNGNEFGILTSKRIPRLCSMKVFRSYGEIEVELSAVPVPLTLKNEAELKLLQNFHVAIFRDVLKTWKPFFVLDNSSYLIVPLDEATVDFEMAEKFHKVDQPGGASSNQTTFAYDDYRHKVVSATYRPDNNRYVVIEVCEEMSPLSPFPEAKSASFKHYFERKYEVKIHNTAQPLLEAEPISQGLNIFFPKAGEQGQEENQKKTIEHLIPEICHNYKFPADYWLKATLLPAITHRIHYLLLAEELRHWLINEGIDKVRGRQSYAVDVDYDDYGNRKKILKTIDDENEQNIERHVSFSEHLKRKSMEARSSDEARYAKTLLLWDRSEMPIDIDRSWLTISEPDINKFHKFLIDNRTKIIPGRSLQPQGSARADRSLMDVDSDHDIGVLSLDGEHTSVQQKDLLKVLTTSKAHDVFDMERYEVLGDGFLKFIGSLYLYKKHHDWHEGHLTSLKGRLVSNRNLLYLGNIFGLPGMIKAERFEPTKSLPAGVALPANLMKVLERDESLLTKKWGLGELSIEEVISGECNGSRLKIFQSSTSMSVDEKSENCLPYFKQQTIGDKVIADAVEAFIGVVVQSLGVQAGLKLCHKLSILPSDSSFGSLLSEPISPRMVVKSACSRDLRIENSHKLEEIIGYKFRDTKYLVQALTHASYPIKAMGTYQQLEFLGDAVLDFLITCYITEQCPKMDPGKLTDLRSALVNNVTLACIVVRNGIQKFLRASNCLLSEAIKRFVDYQASNEFRVVLDQIILLETEDDATNTAESVDVPKVIGDVFESIVGAVYLDSGLNLTTTWNVIYGLMRNELHSFIANVPLQIVRQLFEFDKGSAKPKFFETEKVDEECVAVPVEINLHGMKKTFIGIGKNRIVAKKCAAKLALKALKEQAQ